MNINWNLIRCALNRHYYSEPIKNETLARLVKICTYCGKEVTLSDDYGFKKLNQKKQDIINAINEDSLFRAKALLDDLLKNFGYNIKED